MKKALAILLAAVMLSVLVTGCSPQNAPAATTASQGTPAATAAPSTPAATTAAPAKVYEIDYATASTPDYVIGKAVYLFKELIEKKSEGRVIVNVFDSAQLGSQQELTESCMNGTLQMAYSTTALLSSFVPEIGVFSLPFLWKNDEHCKYVCESEVGKALKDKLAEKTGGRVLVLLAGGFRDMMTNGVKITSIEDYKGVKFRSPESFEYVKMFEALGAVPTPMPFTEMYQAVKTRLVDGLETNAFAMVSNKYYEVGTDIQVTNHIICVDAPMINEAYLKSLPADIQDLIISCMNEAEEWEFQERVNLAKTAYSDLEKLGLTVTYLDKAPLAAACEKVWDEFVKKSPDAKAIIDYAKESRSKF